MQIIAIQAAIAGLIAERDDYDSAALADDAMKAVKTPARLLDTYRYVVEREAAHQLRVRVRSHEPTPPIGQHRPPTLEAGETRQTAKSFMADRFSTGDGRMVLWATATVEDHQARIDMQTRLAGGIQRDIERHQSAIDLIRATPGATCLDDIDNCDETSAA